MRRQKIEEGSATPAVIAGMTALAVFVLLVTGVVGVQVAQVKSQAVADLAALASGHTPSALLAFPADPSVPCNLARQVAERGGTTLARCWADGGDIRVIVSREVFVFGLSFTVTARARAGPSDGF